MWRYFSRTTRPASTGRLPKHSIRPRLEALEDRTCLSGGALQWGQALPSSASSITAMAMQPDGKIVVVGGANYGIGVSRLNANGTLDTTFNGTGTASIRLNNWGNIGEAGTAVAIQPNGQIVVGGYAQVPNTLNSEGVVVRFNANGTVDNQFGHNGHFVYNPGNASVTSLALLPGGVILAGGWQAAATGGECAAFELTSSGKLKTAFGSGGVALAQVGSGSSASGMAVVPGTGQIVLTGAAVVQSVQYGCIVMLTASGHLDPTFNGTGSLIATNNPVAQFNAVALQGSTASGYKIVVAGLAAQTSRLPNFSSVTRYSLSGTLDTSFGGAGTGSFTSSSGYYFGSLALEADGSIVVGGTYGYVGSDSQNHWVLAVGHLSAGGVVDASFGPNGTGFNYAQIGPNTVAFGPALAIDPQTGDIVLGGYSRDTSWPPKYLGAALARFGHP